MKYFQIPVDHTVMEPYVYETCDIFAVRLQENMPQFIRFPVDISIESMGLWPFDTVTIARLLLRRQNTYVRKPFKTCNG